MTNRLCDPINVTVIWYTAGYIMDDDVGERALKRLPQRRLNFIDGSISSYCSILNSPEQLEQIRQAKIWPMFCVIWSMII